MKRRTLLQALPFMCASMRASGFYSLIVVPYRDLKNGTFKLNGRKSTKLLNHSAILVWTNDPLEVESYQTYSQFQATAFPPVN